MGTPLGKEAVISLLIGGILTLGMMQVWEWVKAYVRSNIKVRVTVEANSNEDAYALITDRLESANDYLDDYDDVDVQEI